MGNHFGKIFSISSFGESHGPAIGVVIDGCPAGLMIDEAAIQADLDLRKPGQSKITTQRKESDTVQILSGIFEGKTTGTPIALLIKNEDQKPQDYSHNQDVFRPGHADFSYQSKYGIRDHRGGGRSSARETATRVAAGVIAKQLLKHYNIDIFAHVSGVGAIDASPLADLPLEQLRSIRNKNMVHTADADMALKMQSYIEAIKKQGDTVGGRIHCIIKGCMPGLGAPVFDKLHSDLGKAMLSINAVHGFEYGSGFDGSRMLGSAHNDMPLKGSSLEKGLQSNSNHAGGILGGISTGQNITFNVAFKPVATLLQTQDTIDMAGETRQIKGKGRHDPCVVPRAVVIVEAMAALVLADHVLRNRSSKL